MVDNSVFARLPTVVGAARNAQSDDPWGAQIDGRRRIVAKTGKKLVSMLSKFWSGNQRVRLGIDRHFDRLADNANISPHRMMHRAGDALVAVKLLKVEPPDRSRASLVGG